MLKNRYGETQQKCGKWPVGYLKVSVKHFHRHVLARAANKITSERNFTKPKRNGILKRHVQFMTISNTWKMRH